MAQYTRFPPAGLAPQGAPARALSGRARPQDQPSQRSAQPKRSGQMSARTAGTAASLSVVVLLFLWSLIIPIYFNVGGIRLSPPRLVMLATFVPLFFYWISGKCGRIHAADILLLLYSLWMFVTFNLDGGNTSVEYAAVSVVETMGPYLLARYYIRTRENWEAAVRLLRWFAIIILPAAFIEAQTGFRLYNKIFGVAFPTHAWANYGQRLGMFRAQTVFEHPILYGIFISMFFAPVYLLARNTKSWFKSVIFVAPVGLATFFSLSAGAYMAFNLQVLLLIWGRVMRRIKKHWMVLFVLSVVGYVVIDLLSNRTPFQVFSSYLAFNSGTAYHRVLIAKYGLEHVWNNPWIGTGRSANWARPIWLHSSSVDNFWLVLAMRHGIPGFALFAAAYGAVIIAMTRARPASRLAAAHRDGLAIMLVGLAIAIGTVHLWSATFNIMMFFLGAGAWYSSREAQEPDPDEEINPTRPDAGKDQRARGQTRSGARPRQEGLP